MRSEARKEKGLGILRGVEHGWTQLKLRARIGKHHAMVIRRDTVQIRKKNTKRVERETKEGASTIHTHTHMCSVNAWHNHLIRIRITTRLLGACLCV